MDSDIQDITEQIHRLLLQVSFLILLEKKVNSCIIETNPICQWNCCREKKSRNYNTMQGVYVCQIFVYTCFRVSLSFYTLFHCGLWKSCSQSQLTCKAGHTLDKLIQCKANIETNNRSHLIYSYRQFRVAT